MSLEKIGDGKEDLAAGTALSAVCSQDLGPWTVQRSRWMLLTGEVSEVVASLTTGKIT